MVKSARREYLEAMRKRYRKACKKDKKPILDEFCTNCGYHCKYAIRLLSLRPRPKVKKPGAKPAFAATSKNYFSNLFLWRNAPEFSSKRQKRTGKWLKSAVKWLPNQNNPKLIFRA